MGMPKMNKFYTCTDCGQIKYIVNRTKILCDDCNFKRLHDGKSRAEVALAKAKESAAKKPKRVSAPRKSKPTGERELFAEIWAERPHVCTHCGKELPEPMLSFYFSHIKSKGAFPELRLEKSNIELTCVKCHQEWEFGSRQNNK